MASGAPRGGGLEYYNMVTNRAKGGVGAPPPTTAPGGGLNSPPSARTASTGPSATDIAAANAAREKANFNKEGKDRTAKENAATQGIIDALLASLTGFASGRDQAFTNAQGTLDTTLDGILKSYLGAMGDYQKTGIANQEDEASKSAANVQNRARERMGNLAQVLSQGGGETDAMRALLTVFQNYDANQMDVTRAFNDTERQVNSQIAGANSQAETQRRSAWQQFQEARAQAENDYNKNYMDVWTNIQRTAAGNTNIDTESSTGFTANTGGKNAVDEVARYAGKQYGQKPQDEKWYREFEGKQRGRKTSTSASNRGATATISAPRSAEGATLRREA